MSDRTVLITDGVRQREQYRKAAAVRGIDRIDISVIEGLSYEAVSGAEPRTPMHIGEPVDRGGDGTGATPLSHFLTGAGACILNQFVRVSIAEGLPLRFIGASVRGEFGREVGGRFQRIACEVRAEGSIGERAAEALMTRAERLCYVHQTLIAVVEMTTVLFVDGLEVARHVEGPGAAAS